MNRTLAFGVFVLVVLVLLCAWVNTTPLAPIPIGEDTIAASGSSGAAAYEAADTAVTSAVAEGRQE